MKKLLFLSVLLALPMLLSAQETKKVAVWETKCTGNGISPFKAGLVRGGMEESVDNTPGYIKYDRAMFDAILKEHQFQQSGAVNDEDIRRMGEMAGVQYIIVPEVSLEDNYFYIVTRMLDIETGQSRTAKELCESTPPEIDKACSRLATRLLGRHPDGNGSTPDMHTSAPGKAAVSQDEEDLSSLILLYTHPDGTAIYVSPTDEPKLLDFKQAETACSCKGKGWRLPNKEEQAAILIKKEEIGSFKFTPNYWGQDGKSMVMLSGKRFPTIKSVQINVRCVKEVKKQ